MVRGWSRWTRRGPRLGRVVVGMADAAREAMKTALWTVVVASVVPGVVLPGCFYAAGSLGHGKSGYERYPGSVEEEAARRATRRRRALIAAPLELVGGLGLAALALYSPIEASDDGDDSVIDNLGDGAKEIVGRVALASIGLAAAGGGIGDAVLGATDPLVASPLVRGGALVPADQIDLLAPAPGPRLDVHAGQGLSLRAFSADAGLGMFTWLGPRWRLRTAASFAVGMRFQGEDSREAGATADLGLERAFGRTHAGLYPQHSLGLFAGGGYAWGEASDHALVRAGLTTALGLTTLRLGTVWSPDERTPTVEAVLRRELAVD